MSRERAVHVVVPAGIGDPQRPSGGNTYDRRLCEGLAAAGWSVRTREVPGCWPEAGPESRSALAQVLRTVPDGSVVLVDGLVASGSPEVMVPSSHRLRTVVLMHMPIGARQVGVARDREAAVLRASAAVVTTSDWTRRWVLEAHRLDPWRIHVARPGVEPAALATGGADGSHLLCVAAVTPGKGQDHLLRALVRIEDLPWRCTCVGSLTRSPHFVASLRQHIRDAGLGDRLRLVGPRTGGELDVTFSAAAALVLTSRAETYGMVITEALARGLPVITYDVGGVSEALGVDADGKPPGVLVPAGDVAALAEAFRRWLTDSDMRRRLRKSALARRAGLAGWRDTANLVARVLEGVAA